jgi:hypothetical protein
MTLEIEANQLDNRHRARTALMLGAGVLVSLLLLAAIYLFFGSLHAFGAKGTAAIYDIYANGLAYCL